MVKKTNQLKKYRSIPVEIEALQWTGNNFSDFFFQFGFYGRRMAGDSLEIDITLLQRAIIPLKGYLCFYKPRNEWFVKTETDFNNEFALI